ncbi:MAG TPA: 3-ketoacyl-ACP reductase [Chryseolinea sp.]|nr:3-ketoacyl-ACP reductase [Chryseolinea sp.]
MKKTALITGGSRGIGYGIARSLAAEGYNLAINGVRAEQEVGAPLKELKDTGIDVIYCQGNIGSGEDREQIFQKAIGHFGIIDLLVNNAGVAPAVRQDLLDLDEENYDRLLDINLKGTFFFTQLIARRMLKDKEANSSYSPCIISITSISAEVASVNRGEYCMSKAGLGMMTKLFAARLGDANIPVYEVRPGVISTDMTAGVKEKYDKLINDGLFIERRWGTPEDIGRIVAALARGDIPYSTGQVIQADGGMGIRRL